MEIIRVRGRAYQVLKRTPIEATDISPLWLEAVKAQGVTHDLIVRSMRSNKPLEGRQYADGRYHVFDYSK